MSDEYKTFLNDVEIPLTDCLDNGYIKAPLYMKEGDVFKFVSPSIRVGKPKCIYTEMPTNETIH